MKVEKGDGFIIARLHLASCNLKQVIESTKEATKKVVVVGGVLATTAGFISYALFESAKGVALGVDGAVVTILGLAAMDKRRSKQVAG